MLGSAEFFDQTYFPLAFPLRLRSGRGLLLRLGKDDGILKRSFHRDILWDGYRFFSTSGRNQVRTPSKGRNEQTWKM